MEERQFLREGDARFFSESQGQAKKFGKKNAHFASSCGVDTGERADGVQAIEKKVRIYLGFQRFQFRIPGENAGFLNANFGLVRILDGQDDVVGSDGKKIEKETGAK